MNKTSLSLTLLVFVLLILYSFPVFWMVSSSFKTEKDIYIMRWLPSEIQWDNYQYLFSQSKIVRWTINSLIVSCFTVAGVILLSSLAAYSLSRIDFPGRTFLFYLTLAGILIPIQAIMIPRFLLLKDFKMLNTYFALILPALSTPINVLILSQFFKQIPKDFADAARIDGASELQILFKIVMPLSRPALSAVATFVFVWSWNDFLWPLIVATKDDMYTLPVGLATFYGSYTLKFGVSMAGNVIASLPILVFFIFFQRQLIEGITLGGLKE